MSVLNANINSSVRTLTVDAGPAPAPGTVIKIEDELMIVGDTDGLNWYVHHRGLGGTTAASHLSGEPITQLRPVYGEEATDQEGGSGLPEGVSLTYSEEWGALLTADETADWATLLAGAQDQSDDGSYVNLRPNLITLYTQNSDATTTVTINMDSSTGELYLQPGGGGVLTLDVLLATLKFANLPTSDPGVENAVYTDGTPSAGVPKALMVSGGTAP